MAADQGKLRTGDLLLHEKNGDVYLSVAEDEKGTATAEAQVEFDTKFSQSFTSKKTIANSAMNIALVMSNVSQMKVLITTREEERTLFFIPLLVFLSISLVIQMATAIVLLKSGMKKKASPGAKKLNNASVILVFFVTFINLLISGLV